jgi:hypothetical protein
MTTQPIASCPLLSFLFDPTVISHDELKMYCGKGTEFDTDTQKCVLAPNRDGNCLGVLFSGTEDECNAMPNGCKFNDKGFLKSCHFPTRIDPHLKKDNEIIESCGSIIGFLGQTKVHARTLCGDGTAFKEQSETNPLFSNQCEGPTTS